MMQVMLSMHDLQFLKYHIEEVNILQAILVSCGLEKMSDLFFFFFFDILVGAPNVVTI